MPNGPIDDKHWTCPHGRRHHTMYVVVVGENRFGSCQYHRQVLRLTARHHSVDGNLFHGHHTHVWGHFTEDFLGIFGSARQHRDHAFRRRRYKWQTVREALIEHELDFVVLTAYVNASRAYGAAFCHRPQTRLMRWIDRQGSAARAPLRQAGPIQRQCLLLGFPIELRRHRVPLVFNESH